MTQGGEGQTERFPRDKNLVDVQFRLTGTRNAREKGITRPLADLTDYSLPGGELASSPRRSRAVP
jgi:hypothetical protein